MKINSISATGLKSGDFTHNLGPVTLFTGPNFAGKTARLEATRLALIGYLPEFGLKPASTMKLARNGTLSVSIDTDQGQLSRTWLKGKEPITNGDIPATPPVLMDPSEYFALGPKDRMRYVLSHVQAGEDAGAEIVNNIRYLGVPGEEAAKVISKLTEEIDQQDTIRHEQGCPVQTWLEELIADCREKLRNVSAKVKSFTSMVQGQTMLQAGTATTDHQPEIDRLNGEQHNLTVDMATVKCAIEQHNHTLKLIDELQEVVDKAGPVTMVDPAEIDEMSKAAEAQTGIETARVRVAAAKASLVQEESRLKYNQTGLNEAYDERDTELAQKCCPTCGAKAKGWKKKIEEKWANKINPMAAWVAEQKTIITRIKTEYEATVDMLSISEENECARLQAQHKLLSIMASQQANAKAIAARDRLAALGERSAIENSIKLLQGEQVTLAREHDQKTTRLGELGKLQRARIEAQQDAKRRAQAILERKAYEVEETVLKAAVKALEKYQSDMVNKAFGAIIDRANTIAAPLLKSPLKYRDGEIGREENGAWIVHEVFSGLERAICYAGISYALAADAPCRIILMDELGRMDPEHLVAFLNRMTDLVQAGTIDQVVCAGIVNKDLVIPGKVQVITL